MKIMYLNVNGFYGTSNKNRAKLQIGLDDDCCKCAVYLRKNNF